MGSPEKVRFDWVQLRLRGALANTDEDIDSNIEASLKRNYIRFQDILKTEEGAVSVVGSGPSLKDNWKKLRDSKTDIIACNAAFQFLLERGVVPKYFFCFDADPLMYEFITPHKDVTYLLASRVPPKTWDMLEGCRIVCWHSSGDKNISELLTKHNKMEPMVIGGSAAVTRAMVLAPNLGYNEIHLWGADSSFRKGDTHIRKSTTEEKMIAIIVNKRQFLTAPWMCQQAEDFKVLAVQMRDSLGLKLVVHGDGLIPHLAMTMGFEVDEWKYKQYFREVTFKAKILWSNL